MVFLVEITPIAEAQIEQVYLWYRERNPEFADLWFRSLMNAIARPPNLNRKVTTKTVAPETVLPKS